MDKHKKDMVSGMISRSMRIIGLQLSIILLAVPVAAQSGSIISDTTGRFVFTASADHNTVFFGVPVLSTYTAEIYLKTNPTGTGSPLFSINLSKPTPSDVNAIASPLIKSLATLLPNTEYIYFIRSSGPGGSNRSAPSDPFGYPGAPAATDKPGIQ